MLKRFSEGVTVGVTQMVGAWRFDGFTNFLPDADADGGNAATFYFALYQADRLVAESSCGNEQGDVRVHRLDAVRGIYRGFFNQLIEQRAVNVAHE